MWIRQRPQQHRINHTKNRSVRTDSESEHENGNQGEPRILGKLPDGESEIVH
jgi:hypothetical protein